MNELPHFARFARALAVGITAGSIAVAACSTASSESSNSNTNNTGNSSSGNESTSQSNDGGVASLPPGEHAIPNDPCAVVGQFGTSPSRPPLMCTCTARDAGAPTWECNSGGEVVTGPLPPPDMPA